MEELVAAEEVGAHMRGQNGEVPARTGASFDPAHPETRNRAVRAHNDYLEYSLDFAAA